MEHRNGSQKSTFSLDHSTTQKADSTGALVLVSSGGGWLVAASVESRPATGLPASVTSSEAKKETEMSVNKDSSWLPCRGTPLEPGPWEHNLAALYTKVFTATATPLQVPPPIICSAVLSYHVTASALQSNSQGMSCRPGVMYWGMWHCLPVTKLLSESHVS